MIDVPNLIETYGLPGLIIAGLGMAVVALWKRNNLVTDARQADAKEHASQLIENMRTLDKALDFIRGSRDV